ncbi:MAG: transporter substrate-binding domain-containing protein [Planctomycetota bacterium]
MLNLLVVAPLLAIQDPSSVAEVRTRIVIGVPDPVRARALLAWNEHHEIDGFALRLMQHVGQEIGLEVVFQKVDSEDLLDDLLARKIDVVGPLSVLPERLNRVVFTAPVLIAEGAVFVRVGTPSPRSVEELRTLSVGVAGAGVGHQFCAAHGIPCETGPELRTALRRLANGELDCVVTTRMAGRSDIERLGLGGLTDELLDFEDLQHAFAFALRPDEADLLARLNYGLALARDDGTWDQLYDHWVSRFQPRPRPRTWTPYVIGSLALLAVAGALLVFRLRAHLSSRTRELDESEQRYLAVAESLPALVYSYFVARDGTRTRRFVTSNLAEWRLRFPLLDPGGDYQDWVQAVHPDDRARYETMTARSRAERSRFDVEFRLRASDGSYRWLHAISAPIPGEGGVLWQSLLLDVTPLHEARDERHQLELQLVQAQKLEGLGLLAGGIAHDFNNLLTGIRGNLELATRSGDPALQAQHLSEAQHATLRASELTNQLLAYAGQARLVESVVALDQVAREMIDLLGSSLHARARVELVCATGPTYVRGDATLIRQVVMNLLTNAVEAVPKERQGHIRVSIARRALVADELQEHTPVLAPGTYVMLEVVDDGRGMDAATQARMFEPFFTTKFTGRGLGLSVLQRTLQRHGGAWHVRSSPEVGTCFRILLPAAEGEPAPLRELELMPAPRRRSRFLVVDDDPRVLAVACAMLEARGHAVAAAQDEAQALALLTNFRPDGVLLDLTMPGRGGLELLPLLRRERPTLPVVVMSGYSQRDVTRAGVRIDGFLAKPFSGDDLARMVEAALESASRG